MKNTMGGIKDFHMHSPSAIAKSFTKEQLSNLSCTFYMLHGDMDATVPHSSSIKFVKVLQEAGANAFMHEYPDYTVYNHFICIIGRYKGLGHSHVIFDLMDNVRTSHLLIDVIKIVKQSKTS
jgi:hypothetical protein